MEREERDIVEHSVEEFVKEVVAMTLDGWTVSPTCAGDVLQYNNTYTVSMFRSAETVEKFRSLSAGVGEKPKLTRAEILANARAAKRAKLDVSTVK